MKYMAIIDFYSIVSGIEYFSCLLAILMSICKFLICLFQLTFFHLFCVMYSYSNMRYLHRKVINPLQCHIFSIFFCLPIVFIFL